MCFILIVIVITQYCLFVLFVFFLRLFLCGSTVFRVQFKFEMFYEVKHYKINKIFLEMKNIIVCMHVMIRGVKHTHSHMHTRTGRINAKNCFVAYIDTSSYNLPLWLSKLLFSCFRRPNSGSFK